jgi:hypothetical protein
MATYFAGRGSVTCRCGKSARYWTQEELAALVRADPEWEEKEARAMAEVAAGQGMNLEELRRFLGLPEETSKGDLKRAAK